MHSRPEVGTPQMMMAVGVLVTYLFVSKKIQIEFIIVSSLRIIAGKICHYRYMHLNCAD